MAHDEDINGDESPSELTSPLAPPDGYPAPEHPVTEELSALAKLKSPLIGAARRPPTSP